MRILPILLLALVAGTAKAEEAAPATPSAPQNSVLDQLNARMADLKAQLDAVNSGRAFPLYPAVPPRIAPLRIPAAVPNAAPAGNCAIPLVTGKPDPGVNFTMRKYAPADRMAPMPQIKPPVCEPFAR